MRISWHRDPKVKGLRWFERPIVWGLTYLALIPLFAVFYYYTADGFYQTSAMHETSALDSEFYVEEDVAWGAERAVEHECGSCSRPIDGLDITASATDLLVTLGFPTESGGGDVSVQIDIPEQTLPATLDRVGGFVQVPYSLLSNPNADALSPGLQAFEQYTNSKNNPKLPLRSVDMNDLQQLSDAAQGLVSGLPDQLWRMIYFSAVTETTLGFGDIAPVITFTRILVASQAVFGVVFIGLFLNSLARRRSDVSAVEQLKRG
jgi:hypothetical protein